MYQEKIDNEELTGLPLGAFHGEIVVVDTPDLMDEATEYLSQQRFIGYDTETRPTFRKGAKNTVALMQLSAADRCFLVRLNKTPMSQGMIAIMENDKIVKIGAAIHDDIKAMQELQKFNNRGFVDLQQIVGNYGIADKSVRKIAGVVLRIRISKAQRLSNWEAQNLTPSQQLYAATDAWVCREIYLKLKNGDKNNTEKR